MAKNKKKVEEVPHEEQNVKETPFLGSYKPLPKFNGHCPKCD
jgi:hypothetical protein